MSRLRQNLENAKREYEAARYPGDLARDIAMRKTTGGVSVIIGRSIVAVAAIAALIIVGAIIWPAINRHAETTVPIAMNEAGGSQTDEQPATLALIDVPSWGDVATPAAEGSDADIVLTLASASGESDSLVPSFPSIDEIDTASVDDTLNNQETR